MHDAIFKLIMTDGEDSEAGMASPDLQKQLADQTKIIEMQVQANDITITDDVYSWFV